MPHKWWDRSPRVLWGEWREASTRVGWWLESIFGMGVALVQNQQAVLERGLQLSALANSTSDSLGLLDNQLQHTSRMTIQNQAILDLMLLKEKGVCGVLNLWADECCVHIPNVSVPLQDQMKIMKKVAKDSEVIVAALGTNWLGKAFAMFGFSLSGWLTSLLQSLITVVVVVVVICIVISCVKHAMTKPVLTMEYTPSKSVRIIYVPLGSVHTIDVPVQP